MQKQGRAQLCVRDTKGQLSRERSPWFWPQSLFRWRRPPVSFPVSLPVPASSLGTLYPHCPRTPAFLSSPHRAGCGKDATLPRGRAQTQEGLGEGTQPGNEQRHTRKHSAGRRDLSAERWEEARDCQGRLTGSQNTALMAKQPQPRAQEGPPRKEQVTRR